MSEDSANETPPIRLWIITGYQASCLPGHYFPESTMRYVKRTKDDTHSGTN